jgi:hypothetical protein
MLTKYYLARQLPLLPLALLLACKKDDTNPDTSNIRLFTNKIELTDVAVKTRFLAHASAAFQPLPTVGSGSIHFVATDTATFGASTMRFAVVKNAEQYLFYSPQVVQLTTDNMLLHDMLKYVAPKVPVASTSGSGLSGTYLTKEVRVGHGNAQQIQLSCLQYCWSRPLGRAFGSLYNELNESVVTKVGPADTLAVRVSRVSFLVK